MKFKPLSNETPGTIYRLLFESYEYFLRENPQYRETWQRDWRAYDSDVFTHPRTVGECGFFSYVEETPVGFASFDPSGHPERAIVGHNCILPELRGKGYGMRQLRELLRTLKQRGFHKAVATTGGHEFFASALRMYKCCGFRETDRFMTDAVSGLRTVELERDLSITVRKAEERDFGRVMALFRQLWPGKTLDGKRQWAVYQAMLDSDGYELVCAERKGRVVGFSSLSIQPNFWQEGRIAYITTLIVDKACRSRGVGSVLIDEIQETARDRGCGKIELESAFHRRDAHRFYEKMGFEKRAYFFSKDVA